MDLNQFFEDLASKKPVPGGGSASCVAAAMAAALLGMVTQLSIGRKDDKALDARFKEVLSSVEALKPRLFQLAEEDAQGYRKVMKAFKLPKESPEDKASRKQAIQKAFEGAIATPLALLWETLNLMDWTLLLLEHGNVNAFSDAGVAYHLIRTAFEGGKMNVLINLDSINDEGIKQRYLKKLKEIENAFSEKRQEVENRIKTWIDTIVR